MTIRLITGPNMTRQLSRKQHHPRKPLEKEDELAGISDAADEGPSRPLSLRFSLKLQKEIAKEAKACGWSSNQFVEYAVRGTIRMIRTPENEPLKVPELVTVARILRYKKHEIIRIDLNP